MAEDYDVFFSYSTGEHAAVERAASALYKRGIRVFLDRWYLAAGMPWPEALERTLATCRSVAVFIGAGGLGPWQQRERDLALDRQGREPSFPVIPVLLAATDPGLGFLRLNTWVDLSHGPEDPEALAILEAAIRGEPPGPRAVEQCASVRAAVCPYRGLRPFREEDEPFFFGRGAFTETLTAAVLRQPLVAVVGASGSGKSSVVRAGLIPRLRRGAGNLVWDATTLVPTDRPLRSLAGALLPMLEPGLSEVDRLYEVNRLAKLLEDESVSLRDVADRLLRKQPGTERLLLFVDQWEELYTLGATDHVRTTFIDLLLQAAETSLVRVVLTLRGDFMGHALGDRSLADRLQDSIVTVGPMTRDELAETIARPAEKTGLRFDEGLIETILDDVGDEPGGLPLLEFLLEGLWQERRANVMTHDAFVRLGRVAGAIAHRAEEVFNQGLTEGERDQARRLLVRMVRPGEGMDDTRKRTVLAETDPVAAAIVSKLTHERLVVTRQDPGGAVTAEVAHEALIRRWQRLREWVDADREFLRTRERIAAQARLWETESRPDDRLLPPGRPLAEGEDLLRARRDDLDPLLVNFVEASVSAGRAEEEAARARQRRHVRSARAVALAMTALACVALAVGTFAWRQREDARRSAEEAVRNAEAARSSGARLLSALAEIEATRGSPARAIRLALAAMPTETEPLEQPYLREARGALLQSVRQVRELRRFGDDVSFAAISLDGRILATGAVNGTASLWNVATGEKLITLRGHEGIVRSVAFAPDGRTVATGSDDRTARLWDVSSGREIMSLRGHQGAVYSVAFAPDGQTLATGSEDNTAKLWDARSGREITTLDEHAGSVRAVAFAPNGQTLATGSDDRTARLWQVSSGTPIATFRGHEDGVVAVAFAPDGRTLATGSADDTARVWDVATARQLTPLIGHQDDVIAVAFAPDGRTLATGSADMSTRLWDLATGRQILTLRGHEGVVKSIAFGPDGRTLVTGSGDMTARLWDSSLDGTITTLRGHDNSVRSVAFAPTGDILATGSDDTTARLWNLTTGTALDVLRGHEGPVTSVAFAPDGRTLATGSVDDTAILWDLATGRQIATLRGHFGSVRTVAFAPDGKTLATGSDDDTAKLWDVASGTEIATLRGHADDVLSVAFSQDGKMLATGSADTTARLWEVATGAKLALLRGHSDDVTSVALSPDGKTLATGSADMTTRLWDVTTGDCTATLRGHRAVVKSVAFAPDGRTLATGSGDKTARLWDPATGRAIATLHGHEGGILSVAFDPTGHTLATGSADDTAQLWPGIARGLADRACARVHDLPLSAEEKQRLGIADEWCTPDVSAALRTSLGMDDRSPGATLADRAPARPR